MTWPPPGFDKPCAQRDLRVLVHGDQPYIHTGDLADYLRTQTAGTMPLVAETAGVIADEVRGLGDKALRKCSTSRGDEQPELSARGSVPRLPAVRGTLNLAGTPQVAEGPLRCRSLNGRAGPPMDHVGPRGLRRGAHFDDRVVGRTACTVDDCTDNRMDQHRG